jgi:hypothetical protein
MLIVAIGTTVITGPAARPAQQPAQPVQVAIFPDPEDRCNRHNHHNPQVSV